MKKKTPKKLRELFRQRFYEAPDSRYNRFCKHCSHRGSQGECEAFCYWYGCECFDACIMTCPIPTAMVSMLGEGEAAIGMPNQISVTSKK